jgi:hypothetical protein
LDKDYRRTPPRRPKMNWAASGGPPAGPSGGPEGRTAGGPAPGAAGEAAPEGDVWLPEWIRSIQ